MYAKAAAESAEDALQKLPADITALSNAHWSLALRGSSAITTTRITSTPWDLSQDMTGGEG